MKRAQTCWYWTSVFQRYGNWCVNPAIDMTRQNRLSQTPTLQLFSCSSLWYVPAFGEQQPITNPALSIASFPRVILCSNTHSEMKIDDIEPLLATNLRHFGVTQRDTSEVSALCRGMPEASWPGALLNSGESENDSGGNLTNLTLKCLDLLDFFAVLRSIFSME